MTSLFRSTKMLSTVLFAVFVMGFVTYVGISIARADEHGADQQKSEKDKLMSLDAMWSSKFAQGDIEWIMNLHADDAMQLPPGQPLIKGKEAIRAAWQGMIDTEGLELSWKPTTAAVSASNDMAYTWGEGKLKHPDGSVQDAKYTVIWTNHNGEWKVVVDVFNVSGPPTK